MKARFDNNRESTLKLSTTIAVALALTAGFTTGAMAQGAASPAAMGRAQPTTSASLMQPAQVKAAQQKLQAAGLYRGPADGLIDPDTEAAIARFQQQNGLPRTETLDQATYARLMTIPAPTTGYGSSGPAATTTRPPSASYHASTLGAGGNNSKNTPGGASTWQPQMVEKSKNGPGGASTWQPPMVTKAKNTPGG